jgi:hypothetical protein
MDDRSSGVEGTQHEVASNQPFQVRTQFSNLSLIEANEILVNDETGQPSSPPVEPPTGTQDDAAQANAQRSDEITYVIRTPAALQSFLATQPANTIKNLRLMLLYPLESIQLIEVEWRGDKGPNVDPVSAAWRYAFKSIPSTIQLIKVDISHSFNYEEDRGMVFGRLAQLLTTTVYLRSRRKAEFMVVGARTRKGKAFLEGSMAGLREAFTEGRRQRFASGDE